MKLNMGLLDRVLRLIFAGAVAYFYFTGKLEGTPAIVLGVLAAIFLLTSLVGFCPLYAPFKLSTRRGG